MTRRRFTLNVEVETTVPMGSEERREAVYVDGGYVGEIVYISRRRKARNTEIDGSSTGFVTDYGWRPDGWRYAKNAKLTDKAGAIARLRPIVEVSP